MTRATLILLTGAAAAALTACGRDWTSNGEPMRPMRVVSPAASAPTTKVR